ncbi:MAG: DUF1080 domain-containing protein, partial [Chloroflexi bacterium]|nr:DUF1080 domain-containing protein [Chloroflexota bacterium]
MITLNVTGGVPGETTKNIQAVFTAAPTDVFTPTHPILGGGLIGQSVTVVRSGHVVTFTFPSTFELDADGTIAFPLYRPCGATGNFQAQVNYMEQCRVRSTEASLTTTTRNADLNLFTTPNKITLGDRSARWRFYVSNGGDAAATTTYVTNTLPLNHHFAGFTVTSELGSPALLNSIQVVTATLPSGREIVTFTIPATPGIPPGVRLQFDAHSTFPQCITQSQVDIALFAQCSPVSSTCGGGRTTGSVQFEPAPTGFLSSNNQSSSVGLCEAAQTKLVVKNISTRSQQFDLTIRNSIQNGTFIGAAAPHVTVTDQAGQPVTGATSHVVLNSIPFTPSLVVTDGVNSVFTWTVTSFAVGTPQYDVLKVRNPGDQIVITFNTKTGCVGASTDVQSSGTAKDVCDNNFTFVEESKSLIVDTPELIVTKRGRNVTTGSALGSEVYANAGDTVVWQIDVQNRGRQNVTNLFVNDTVPGSFTINTINHPSGYGTVSGNSAEWGSTGGLPLDPDQTTSFIMTGTVTAVAICTLATENVATANYGCSNSDLCLNAPVEARATLRMRPTLESLSSSGSLSTCGGPVTLKINITGPDASNVIITDTLPAGFVYEAPISMTASSGIIGLIASPLDGDAHPVWRFSRLPGNQPSAAPTTTTLVYRIRNANVNSTCAVIPTTVNNPVNIQYGDSCTASGPYTLTNTSQIGVSRADLAIQKRPVQQISDVGKTVTWTVTVVNNGNTIAPNIALTDVVQSGFHNVTATNGNVTGTSAQITGNRIIWTPPFTLAVGGAWTARVSAAVNDSGQHTNTVQVVGRCGSGACIYDSDSATSYVTLLNTFSKTPKLQNSTIGSLAVFTVNVNLPDIGPGLYSAVTLTDGLPTGLGYVAASLLYTASINNTPTVVRIPTPNSAPAANASGNLRWTLGNLFGPLQVTAVITAVVQNIASNYDGVQQVNTAKLSYVDDSRYYQYTDTATVNITEPLLHISKNYLTNATCSAMLFQTNFNNNSAAGWSALGTWSAANGLYSNTSNSADRRAFVGSPSLTNYSYSFMMRTTDAAGSMGGYVRQNNASTVDQGYLFRFSNTQMLLERRNGSSGVTLASTATGTGYQTNRWYQVEIKAVGSLLQVYVDGVLRLSATDSTYANGRVGFYTSSLNATNFDDALVTRLGNSSCMVGASDLITYTLTISNQGSAIGQDLIITDVLPAGLSYVASTLTSNDPSTAVSVAPVVGATNNLLWRINQLAATLPFNATIHKFLTLNVVLRVAGNIGAAAILPNQALLAYDSQPNTGPVNIQRTYSGGSHSTATQTVAPALLKSRAPQTVTIGEAFRYTLTVPSSVISATLSHITVTDQIPTNFKIIGTPKITGGIGGS